MTPDPEFQQLVARYLEHHTTREFADEFECIPATVKRYALGLASPMPRVREEMKRYIKKVMEEEGWE